jgi:hypothetical protein
MLCSQHQLFTYQDLPPLPPLKGVRVRVWREGIAESLAKIALQPTIPSSPQPPFCKSRIGATQFHLLAVSGMADKMWPGGKGSWKQPLQFFCRL